MSLPIETEDLGKRYGDVRAVDGLSLRVAEGEIYAFLGLNGAGKTTTIRMLLGMIRPTRGWANVLGVRVRPGRREPWQDVGYLVEMPHAYPELTVIENLEAARRLHPGTPRQAVGRAVEQLGLAAYAQRRAGTLSQGNAQRLGLAKALLHRPKLLFLDEPANGLDPAGIVEIRALLLELTRQQGVTVFMSSHILAEVARLAQRIGIIHQGRLLQEMSIDELERDRRRRLLLRTRDQPAARAALAAAGRAASLLDDGARPGGGAPGAGGQDAGMHDAGMLALDDADSLERPDDVNCLLVQAGLPPTELRVEEEELERYFLRLVGINGSAPRYV